MPRFKRDTLAVTVLFSIATAAVLWWVPDKEDIPATGKAVDISERTASPHRSLAAPEKPLPLFGNEAVAALKTDASAYKGPGSSAPQQAASTEGLVDSNLVVARIVGMSVEELCEWELLNPYAIELTEMETRWLEKLVAINNAHIDEAWKDVQTRMHHYVRELRSVGDFEAVEGRPGGRPEPEFPGQMTAYILKDGVLGAVRIDPGDYPDLDALAERERETHRAFFNEVSSFFTAPFDPGPAPPPRKYGIMIR